MNPPSIRDRVTRPIFARKMLWLAILTTLVAALIIILPRVNTPAPAIDSKLLAVRMLFAAIFALAAINCRTVIARPWQFTDTLFAGLAVSFLASAIFSGRVGYCLSEFWHIGAFYCLGWLVYRLRPVRSECIALVRVAGTMGLIAAIYGFLVYIGFDVLKSLYPFEFEGSQGGGRNFIHSFYGNPEYFGGVAAPTAILLLGLGMAPSSSLLKRGLWIAASLFIILVLLLSGSRGALFGFALGAAIVFFGQVQLLPSKLRRASWAALLAGLVAFAVGLVIFSTPNPINRRDMRLAQRFTTIFETTSDSTRERILFYTSTAMAIPKNPVFGYGPGTYRLEFFNNVKLLVDADPRAGTTILLNALDRRLAEHTHNDYLEFWFEQGTLGIALLLLLIVHGAVRFTSSRVALWRQRLSATTAELTAIHVTLFAAAATILVNALTSFPLHMPARGTLAWLLIGAFFASDAALSEARKAAAGNSKSLQNDEKVEI